MIGITRNRGKVIVNFGAYAAVDVLRALHDSAKTYAGATVYCNLGPLDAAYAEQLLSLRKYFDGMNGRRLQVNFSKYPIIDATQYEAINGLNSAVDALDMLYKRTLHEI